MDEKEERENEEWATRVAEERQALINGEREARKKQKATKYSDEEIKDSIYSCMSGGVTARASIVGSLIIANMIAYNNMIDERWRE